MGERMINIEARAAKMEVTIARHDVKLNLIAYVAGATFITSLSTLLAVIFHIIK
jgi:hypothetical protein